MHGDDKKSIEKRRVKDTTTGIGQAVDCGWEEEKNPNTTIPNKRQC